MTGAPMGLLERCHAYKDKKAKGLTADAGLFTYPVLQAADILAYDSDTVPVGEDQVQHIEVCRDLAGSFNHQFGDVFVMPKAHVLEASARVPGTDGEKMSKSYNNTLARVRRRQRRSANKSCGSSPTRGRWTSRKNRPATCCSISIRSSPTTPSAKRWRPSIAAAASATAKSKRRSPTRRKNIGPKPRARRAELAAKPDDVREVLAAGAAEARKKAADVLSRAQAACGVRWI